MSRLVVLALLLALSAPMFVAGRHSLFGLATEKDKKCCCCQGTTATGFVMSAKCDDSIQSQCPSGTDSIRAAASPSDSCRQTNVCSAPPPKKQEKNTQTKCCCCQGTTAIQNFIITGGKCKMSSKCPSGTDSVKPAASVEDSCRNTKVCEGGSSSNTPSQSSSSTPELPRARETISPPIDPVGKPLIIFPGAFRPPHRGHYLEAEQAVKAHVGSVVLIIVYDRTRHGVTTDVTKSIWSDIYTPMLKSAGAADVRVVETTNDPHHEAWGQCAVVHSAHNDAECLVLAGPDRGKYENGVKSFSFIKYDVAPVRQGGSDLSATNMCEQLEKWRKSGKTKVSDIPPEEKTQFITKYLPEGFDPALADKLIEKLLPVATKAD